MTNVVLIGYRGAGKTTVGQLLAARLGLSFVDTDALVAQRAGRSIADIFAESGEAAFRDLEADVIQAVAAQAGIVLSAGGGAVLRDENVRALRACGAVFWLTADADTLWARMRADPASAQQRPRLTEHDGIEEVRKLLVGREGAYACCAHHRIDVAARTPEQVVEAIEQVLRARP
jgi:shikimate kinase